MKKFSQQFHKKASTVKMTTAERSALRERLESYMEYHPLSESKPDFAAESSLVATDKFKTVSIPFGGLFKVGLVSTLALVLVLPFVAQKSMPGDTLYAVKVQFNEELRSTLTFGSNQKVEWETERLNRRLAEARLLASEGRLTKQVEAEVAEAVLTHTANAKREIEVLRTEDADEATIASISLDTTLAVQATSLQANAVAETNVDVVNKNADSLIVNAIVSSLDQAMVVSSTTIPSYDKLMARVESNTTRIYELRDSLEGVVVGIKLREVDRRISDLERSVESVIDPDQEDQAEAKEKLVEVLQRTQRLIVFMTELEVSETVDIETLVPVMLTADEKAVIVNERTAALDNVLQEIGTQAKQVEDESVSDKISLTQQKVSELQLHMKETAEDDFGAFVLLADEADALTGDLLIALSGYSPTSASDGLSDLDTATSTATSSEVVDSEEVEDFELPENTEESDSEVLSASSTGTNIEIDVSEGRETGVPEEAGFEVEQPTSTEISVEE